MPAIRFDDSRHPLTVTEWPEGVLEDADIEAWLSRSMRAWDRGRHLVLHVGMRATSLNAAQRKRLGDFTRKHEHRLAEVVIATAIVAESAVVRGAITAINWFAPPKFPQRVFSTRLEAETWLQERLLAERQRATG